MSPTLYNIVVDDIMQNITCLSNSHEDMERSINALSDKPNSLEVSTNIYKTKMVRINEVNITSIMPAKNQ